MQSDETELALVQRDNRDRLNLDNEQNRAALREAVIEAARQGLRPKRRNFRNPHYKPTPAFQLLMNIVGPTNALAEQVQRGEIDVSLALNGFTDDAMRKSCLRGVTQCRDFLNTFLDSANNQTNPSLHGAAPKGEK